MTLLNEIDKVVLKMKGALDEMHRALISKNYDDFENADIMFCKIWDDEVKEEMFIDNADERRLYHCSKKFYEYRKAWCKQG